MYPASSWVGFDVLLILVLLATAYLAWRGEPKVGLLAGCAATMLVVDAWFDVTTASAADRPLAIILAVCAELPLAVLGGWVALHVERVIARRFRYLMRRNRERIPG